MICEVAKKRSLYITLEFERCIEFDPLHRMKFLLKFLLPNFGESPTILKRDNIVVGSVTTWLGFKSITKTTSFEGHHVNNIIENKACIKSILNHSNFIKVFYCDY
uniref:Uncharacterized protein n=1 Tax=Physcomitrium patens TaxID=3218 RepID=A0A2K1IXI3_PHYPA|nr:hypothetical protein PHYPA_023802 [Physcomitrium patens]